MRTRSLLTLTLSAAILLSGSLAWAAGQAPAPSICTRSCWSSRGYKCSFGTNSTWNRVCFHHTANTNDFNVTTFDGSKARVRANQNYHMDTLGWCDIGYHYLVDKFGNRFEGLYASNSVGSFPRGAHDAINNNSMGISLLGWFDWDKNGAPPNVMRQAAYDVIAWRLPNPFTGFGSSSYGSYSNIGHVYGHYNVSSKTCPGNAAQQYIGTNMTGGEARTEIHSRVYGTRAQYVSNTFVGTATAGSYVTVSVTYKNIGTRTWDSNTRLGTSNPRDRNSAFYNPGSWIGANRACSVSPSTVAPGQNGVFTFTAKIPSTTGNYQEHFRLVQEGVTWFEAMQDVIWYVTVVAGSTEIIVDNSSANFSASSNWWTGSFGAPYGSNYHVRGTESIGDAATWNYNLSSGGTYTVSAWWTDGSNRSATAPYVLTRNGGTSTVYVNQQVNGGKWNSLGSFTINSGANNVKLSCWTTAGFFVIADAVKIAN